MSYVAVGRAAEQEFSKSQIAIEYCYRYKLGSPNAHVFWVYGGNISRFDQGYKRIAQALELPFWDDPETSVRELVFNWFNESQTPFLLVVDNADDITHWWPGKYNLANRLDDPSSNLANFLPSIENESGRLLITTRDGRVATRLTRQGKPINLRTMSNGDAKSLFLHKAEGEAAGYDAKEIEQLVQELDYLPLAISQAAAFIEENGVSILDYLEALQGDDVEEYLHENLDDSRRDEQSVNSVFRTWKLSFDQIEKQKPKAADLLSLFASLDWQSIPKFLIKNSTEFKSELTTSLGTLQSFNLITLRAGKDTFQLHRLVQRFVQTSSKVSGTLDHWQSTALALVSTIYPTVIGVNEWDICDTLAPHVQILLNYDYSDKAAQLHLAHLLCWAADFDIERGMYLQALDRSKHSLELFRKLVPESDERRAAATWLYGRLRYYEAKSAEDMKYAAQLLEEALRTSNNVSMIYAESAFELAHLYYDQGDHHACLKMGKASFESWKAKEGPSSKRSLDNRHDYALELAMCGHEEEAIANWNEILSLCPQSPDASENTRKVFEFRSLASIAEFQGDSAIAEILYQKLIKLCTAIYNDQHTHVFDYRLSHAETILRQGRLEEAIQLSQDILASYQNKSEWQIRAGSLQILAEGHRLQRNSAREETSRLECLELHQKILGRAHHASIDVLEDLARCYMSGGTYGRAEPLWHEITEWRKDNLSAGHISTVRAIECAGVCAANRGLDADAEGLFRDALGWQSDLKTPRLLSNLCAVLWNQEKWQALEKSSREIVDLYATVSDHTTSHQESDFSLRTTAHWHLITALEAQGKLEQALALRASELELEAIDNANNIQNSRQRCREPPVRSSEVRRFGRMIHPRTWSS